ncbi:uncharacterized protein ACBT57_010999 [Dama dama]
MLVGDRSSTLRPSQTFGRSGPEGTARRFCGGRLRRSWLEALICALGTRPKSQPWFAEPCPAAASGRTLCLPLPCPSVDLRRGPFRPLFGAASHLHVGPRPLPGSGRPLSPGGPRPREVSVPGHSEAEPLILRGHPHAPPAQVSPPFPRRRGRIRRDERPTHQSPERSHLSVSGRAAD